MMQAASRCAAGYGANDEMWVKTRITEVTGNLLCWEPLTLSLV